MSFEGKHVLVTGGHGFLGTHVVKELKARGCENITTPALNTGRMDHPYCDFSRMDAIYMFAHFARPVHFDVIIHLAAKCGGIGFNQRNPATLFVENMVLGMNLLEFAKFEKAKLVMVGTVCSYPMFPSIPFKEDDLWEGHPEYTNAPYGVAKRALITAAQAYHQQYGLNVVTLIPANMYGPHDHFEGDDTHVIPGMIKKFSDAKKNKVESVELWGDGTPTRDFLYVEDAAEAIVSAAESYNEPEPLNLGTGVETDTGTLAHTIAKMCDYKGAIRWNDAKPNGQIRRCIDSSRAKEKLGWEAETKLLEGLTKTVEWYRFLEKIGFA